MIVAIHVPDAVVETSIPSEWMSGFDTSKLYNHVARLFPNNNWQDVCCDSVIYRTDSEIVDIFMSCW